MKLKQKMFFDFSNYPNYSMFCDSSNMNKIGKMQKRLWEKNKYWVFWIKIKNLFFSRCKCLRK